MKWSLYCSQFAHLNKECCASCHGEWEEGHHTPLESSPPEEDFFRPNVMAFICCSLTGNPFLKRDNLTRADFAKALLVLRKETRGRRDECSHSI